MRTSVTPHAATHCDHCDYVGALCPEVFATERTAKQRREHISDDRTAASDSRSLRFIPQTAMPVYYRVRSIPTDSRMVEFSIGPAVPYTCSRHFLAIKITQCSEIPAISRTRLRAGRVRQNPEFRGVGPRSGKRHSSCETTSALASRPGTRCVCNVLPGCSAQQLFRAQSKIRVRKSTSFFLALAKSRAEQTCIEIA